MPPVNKKQLNLLKEEAAIKKQLVDLDRKLEAGFITDKELEKHYKLNEALEKNTKARKAFDAAAVKSMKTIGALGKKVRGLAEAEREAGDPKFGNFLDKIADQSKAASLGIATATNKLKRLNKKVYAGTCVFF